jgi:hypothetical protein
MIRDILTSATEQLNPERSEEEFGYHKKISNHHFS